MTGLLMGDSIDQVSVEELFRRVLHGYGVPVFIHPRVRKYPDGRIYTVFVVDFTNNLDRCQYSNCPEYAYFPGMFTAESMTYHFKLALLAWEQWLNIWMRSA